MRLQIVHANSKRCTCSMRITKSSVTVLLYREKEYKQVIKTFSKMLRDVGMAVPKTTETRYGGGSVQARQGIQGLYK